MEHELFYSKFKSSIGRSSLLEIIRDSPLGENPHRVVAMELIFDRTIDDCQERMLAQTKKPSRADPVVQPNSRGESASTLAAVTQPTKARPPPTKPQSETIVVQPVQIQHLRTEQVSQKVQPSQPPKIPALPSNPPPKPSTNIFGGPLPAPPTSQKTSGSFCFGHPSLAPPTSQMTGSVFGFTSQRSGGPFGGQPPAMPTPETAQHVGGSFPAPSQPKQPRSPFRFS